jgi:predicted MPP superfamily phosphohydrolase
VFHLYNALAFLYLLWRFVPRLPGRRACHWSVALLLLVASQVHLLSLIAFGNMWSPEVPFAIALVMGWLFCTFVLLLAFVLLLVIAGLLRWLVWRTRVSAGAARRLTAGAGTMALMLAAVGVHQATAVPEVHRVTVDIQGLPPALAGLRLVQLSDLHLSSLFREGWAQAVVQRTNALSPDLIVITGDLIDGSVQARRADVAPLRQLRARHGVLAIPGNHEYYFGHPDWADTFSALGLRMLTNEHVVVRKDGAALTVAGITDEAAQVYGQDGPQLGEALAGAPVQAPVILLSHRPAGAAVNAASGVALQLSGHTHGGMLPVLDLLAGPANQGFVSRGYQVGGMSLYVSNGTGLWMGFPMRLGVPAEITEFTLQTGRANALR